MRTNTVLGSVSDLDLDPNGSGLKLTPGSAIGKKIIISGSGSKMKNSYHISKSLKQFLGLK
jgi:hypothetical protein